MRLEIRQNQAQTQIQTLKQWLSPKMIQVMRTFHLPYSQLVQNVESAVQDNVFLEITRYDQIAAPIAQRKQSSRSDYVGGDEPDAFNSVIEQKSLQQHLLDQLRLESLSSAEIKIAEAIIDHIDDKGYLIGYDRIRPLLASRHQVAERKVGDILKVVQDFDPDGVGARSLKECLQIQLRQLNLESDTLAALLQDVIANHLDDLGDNKHQKIADALDIELDGVKGIAEFIRTQFNPYPGQLFSKAAPSIPMIPSFELKIVNNKVAILNLEASEGIQIGISSEYLNKLKASTNDEKTLVFLEERYEKAKLWVELLQKRQENLAEIVKHIAEHQNGFVFNGVAFLKPLLQKDIASSRNISPSTVSRIVSSKYVQTPHGIFALKSLCPRSYFGLSQSAMTAEIKSMIEKFPNYSDQKIADALAQQGLKIARRTVNKYRHSSK